MAVGGVESRSRSKSRNRGTSPRPIERAASPRPADAQLDNEKVNLKFCTIQTYISCIALRN